MQRNWYKYAALLFSTASQEDLYSRGSKTSYRQIWWRRNDTRLDFQMKFDRHLTYAAIISKLLKNFGHTSWLRDFARSIGETCYRFGQRDCILPRQCLTWCWLFHCIIDEVSWISLYGSTEILSVARILDSSISLNKNTLPFLRKLTSGIEWKMLRWIGLGM